MNNLRSLLLVAVLTLLSAPAAAVTLKIATLSPEGSGWMKVLREHGKRIEEATAGEVKLKFYPGGVMGDDKAVLRKMRVGQLHGAVVTSGGLVQSYKDIALYSLPMMFRDEAEIDYVRERMDAELMAGLKAKKFVGFGFAEVGFAYPMSQRRAQSVAEYRKLKVWVPDNDPSSLKAYQAFQIPPIPLPIADVLAGLQTGLINAIGSPPIGAIALQWHTQVEHALELPLLYVYGLFAMAERPFNRLTADQQAIVSKELSAAVQKADASARKDHESAKVALTAQGLEWSEPTAAQLAEWQRLADEANRRIVDDGFISEGAYRRALELIAEYRAGGG